MLNLVEPMEELQRRREQIVQEYTAKIKGIDEAFAILQDMNETCPNCNGKGKILRTRACAEDDRPDPNDPRDWNTCSWCHGSGRAQHNEKG